jgi:hypothetical protein
MANLWQASKALVAAAANNIAASQSPAAAAIVLNGSAVSGGVATLDTQRRIIVTSGGNDTGIFFTVIGTNGDGNPIRETIAGVNNGAAATLLDFLTVSSVTHTGSIATTVTVGTNDTGSTEWFSPDRELPQMNFGICVVVSGTVTYSVEYTYDLPNAPFTGTTPTIFVLAAFSAKTATVDGSVLSPVTAFRVTITSGTGTIKAIIVPAGLPN